jgi:hypothetical protein
VKDEEEAEMIYKENTDETHFEYKNLRKPNVLAKVNANNCKLSITKDAEEKFGIISSAWNPDDGSLEIFLC